MTPTGRARPRLRPLRPGFALEATLVVLLLMVVLIGAVATGAATMTRTSNVDQSTAKLVYAVDGAADQVMSQLIYLIQQTGIPTAAQVDSLPLPDYAGTALDGITVTDTVRAVGTAQRDSIRSGSMQGLFATYASYDLDITARDRADNIARSIVRVETQLVPIFQFGVFYNNDLEILPGDSMVFAGRVHTNGNLYLCASRLFFREWLTTPNQILRNRKDRDENNCANGGSWRPNIANAAGTFRPLGFDSRGTDNTTCCSNPASFRDSSIARFSGRVQSAAFAVDSLNVPLPPGVDPRELVEPRTGTEPLGVRLVKLAYLADWYLAVDYNDVGSVCTSLAANSIRAPGLSLPDAATCASIFSGNPAAFWNQRENRFVRTLEIDVGALRSWVQADTASRRVSVLYVAFRNMPALASPAGVSGSNPQPAVRLRNAARLPGPFTLSSHAPVYLQGDYNYDRTLALPDTAWRPSSIIADAITILSTKWLDGWNNSAARQNFKRICRNNSTSFSVAGFSYNCSANPGTAGDAVTYVRAAIAAGHSPTTRSGSPLNADWFDVGSNTTYGGGFENFPRFLENWEDNTVQFRGSLVSLFYSRVANWQWGGGGVYDPPRRDWGFDMRFRLPCPSPSMGPTNDLCLPPGTPKVGSVYQIAYRPVY
jgi:type II secretory pathway pseudopilin PulG